ncbi:hypothetical protein [uncultured Sulfitobacter sp.]|uniref:hypothetical protein n=1 Tax=uncultured Sulfitobacter sp. TaxID=191468 RepID=UPI0026354BC5|nr:hypothetical protein [uncultured Sulfitobacter sp.]
MSRYPCAPAANAETMVLSAASAVDHAAATGLRLCHVAQEFSAIAIGQEQIDPREIKLLLRGGVDGGLYR